MSLSSPALLAAALALLMLSEFVPFVPSSGAAELAASLDEVLVVDRWHSLAEKETMHSSCTQYIQYIHIHS